MSRQLQRTREEADVSTRIAYFVLGGTIGALVALMLAPKSGRELREDLADATRKGVDRTRETAAQLGSKAGEYYDAASTRAGELAGAAREAASRRGESFSAALEAGKQAYKEEKRRTDSTDMEPAPTYYDGAKK